MDATVGALAASLGGEVIGDPDRAVANALALDKAGPDCITFLADEVKTRELAKANAAAIFISRARLEELTDDLKTKHTFIDSFKTCPAFSIFCGGGGPRPGRPQQLL